MKEDKELIERLGKEWSKFWIQIGMEVYHRTMIEDNQPKEGSFVMIVDSIVKKPVKTDLDPNVPQPYRIVGVKCHWFIDSKFQSGLFHTKELLPSSVVLNGTLEDWLDRFKK